MTLPDESPTLHSQPTHIYLVLFLQRAQRGEVWLLLQPKEPPHSSPYFTVGLQFPKGRAPAATREAAKGLGHSAANTLLWDRDICVTVG